MPKCSCQIDGVAKTWSMDVQLIERLNKSGRLIAAPDGKELKPCNKAVAHNARVLMPLLIHMAQQPAWELFSLPAVTKEFLSVPLY